MGVLASRRGYRYRVLAVILFVSLSYFIVKYWIMVHCAMDTASGVSGIPTSYGDSDIAAVIEHNQILKTQLIAAGHTPEAAPAKHVQLLATIPEDVQLPAVDPPPRTTERGEIDPTAFEANPAKPVNTLSGSESILPVAPRVNAHSSTGPRILCFVHSHNGNLHVASPLSEYLLSSGCDGVRIVLAVPFQEGQRAPKPGAGIIHTQGAHFPELPKGVELLTLLYAPHRTLRNERDKLGTESRDNLWQKTHHMLLHEYLSTRNAKTLGYDWYVKVDDDTVFIPANFKRLVSEKFSARRVPAYLGHAVQQYPHSEADPDYNVGACYAINYATLELVGWHMDNSQLNGLGHRCSGYIDSSSAEDVLLELCLRQAYITANSTRDSDGREHFLPFRFLTHYRDVKYTTGETIDGEFKKDWFWANKDPKNVFEEAVAKYPVAGHGYNDHDDKDGALVLKIYDRIRKYQHSHSGPNNASLVPLSKLLEIDKQSW